MGQIPHNEQTYLFGSNRGRQIIIVKFSFLNGKEEKTKAVLHQGLKIQLEIFLAQL